MKKSDRDDWGKLKRMLKDLKLKTELKPTLSVGDMSVLKWWVDASYEVN